MLESILNDPQLNSKAAFSIILLPPNYYLSSLTPDSSNFTDYLGKVTITNKKKKKKKKHYAMLIKSRGEKIFSIKLAMSFKYHGEIPG
jgi:hypothetical protein